MLQSKIPLSRLLAVLLGFPMVSTLLSLLLLHRSWITSFGLDFFPVFWLLISFWYVIQIGLIRRLLKASGWTWEQIGVPRRTYRLVGGYLLFSAVCLSLIEYLLRQSPPDPAQWEGLSSLTPRTTWARVIFIGMGLVAGLSEEIVYRGFAIRALESNGVNKWVAVAIAAVPFVFQHGLKSIDQFGWFLSWGLVFGCLFLWLRKLTVPLILHWLVILSAMLAVLKILR